jgi:hypothetical protein
MTIILLIYLPLCILVGCLAISKNRSFFGWFLLSLLFSPIIAILALIVVPVSPAQHDDVLYLRERKRVPRDMASAVLILGLTIAGLIAMATKGTRETGGETVSTKIGMTPAEYHRYQEHHKNDP